MPIHPPGGLHDLAPGAVVSASSPLPDLVLAGARRSLPPVLDLVTAAS